MEAVLISKLKLFLFPIAMPDLLNNTSKINMFLPFSTLTIFSYVWKIKMHKCLMIDCDMHTDKT